MPHIVPFGGKLGETGLVEFDPKAGADNDAKSNAVINYAKQVKDWPTLEIAVDKKLDGL
jgi:hypothetical protein